MSNELVLDVKYELTNGETIALNEQIVRNLTNNNPNITKNEIGLFLQLCKAQKLNPLTHEAYLIKYDTSKPANQIISYQAFLRIADENPQYDGMEDGITITTKDGVQKDIEGCIVNYQKGEQLLGGWAKVYRKDRTRPTLVKILFSEYSKTQATWKTMPAVMINKCAKVNAIKKAFPAVFCRMETEETFTENQEEPQQPKEEISVEEIFGEPEPQVQPQEIQSEELNDLPDFPDMEVVPEIQQDDWFPINYSEYKNNTSKYFAKPNSYNKEDKTILVKLKK